MVKPQTERRLQKESTKGIGKILLMTLPAVGAVLGFMLLMLPNRSSEDKVEPKKAAAEVGADIGAEDTEARKTELAYSVAAQAYQGLEEQLNQLDRAALRFERERQRGTFDTDGTDALVRHWGQWADDFRQRFDEAGLEFEIDVKDLDRDVPTPVHVAYRLVRKLPFEIERAWEDGDGLEDLPARIEVKNVMKKARLWLEDHNN